MARATYRQVPAKDLKKGMIIIDSDGNDARVIRIRSIDHKRGRLETDLTTAAVELDMRYPVKQ